MDRYGALAEYLSVGRNFDPQVGFRRRFDINRSFGQLRFSPRPTRIPNVRKFTWTASGEYVANGAGAAEARVWTGQFGSEFDNSDVLSVVVTHDYEVLRVPFTPCRIERPAASFTTRLARARVDRRPVRYADDGARTQEPRVRIQGQSIVSLLTVAVLRQRSSRPCSVPANAPGVRAHSGNAGSRVR